MSRAQLTSTDQQNSGGPVSPFVAGKNFAINGGFDIFQRGSFSSTSQGYAIDRWFVVCSGSSSSTVVTQQTTGVPIGSRYCMRVAMGASGGYGNPSQFIETANVAPLQGQYITVQAKVRKNSSFTASSISLGLLKSSTVDAGIGATWVAMTKISGIDNVTNANIPTGTGASNWYQLSVTYFIPNDGTANSLYIGLSQSSVESSGAYWEIAQVQLEVGSVATPFSRAGGTVQGELAACKRYTKSISSANPLWMVLIYLSGYGNSYSQTVYFDVPMRTTPTITCTDNAGTSGKITGYTTSGTLTNALVPSFVFEYDNSGNAVGLRTSVSGNYPYAEVYNVIISAEL